MTHSASTGGYPTSTDVLARLNAHCDATFEAAKNAAQPLSDLGAQRTAQEHNTLLGRRVELEARYEAAAAVRRRLMRAIEHAERFLCAAQSEADAQPIENSVEPGDFGPDLGDYQPGQWWLKQLFTLWSNGECNADTRRAAKVACDFAAAVFAERAQPAEDLTMRRLRNLLDAVNIAFQHGHIQRNAVNPYAILAARRHVALAAPASPVIGQGEQAAAPDPVVEANRQLLLDRSRIGVAKYGVTLDSGNLSHHQLLRHALEEALDFANYIQAAMRRLPIDALQSEAHEQTGGAHV